MAETVSLSVTACDGLIKGPVSGAGEVAQQVMHTIQKPDSLSLLSGPHGILFVFFKAA